MFSPFKFVFTTIIIIGSILLIGIFSARVIKFYALIDEFTIKEAHVVCEKPLNNRCIIHYTIDRPVGGVSDFVPFGDQFTSYPLKNGTRFKKDRFGFTYKLDDQLQHWPALWRQLWKVALGCLGIFIWYFVGGVKALKIWLKLLLAKFDA